MNCKHCQKPLDENAKVCGYCGARVPKKRFNLSKKQRVFVIVAEVFLVLLLIFIIEVRLMNKSLKTAKDNTDSLKLDVKEQERTFEQFKEIQGADNVKLFYIDRSSIEVSPDEVELYKKQGWIEEKAHEALLKTYREKPFFALEEDSMVLYGTDNHESIMHMTYSDFKDAFGDKILYVSEITDGLYYSFDVITADANYTFLEGRTAGDKDSFVLCGISTTSDKLTFGRGIKVGQNISEIEDIIPETEIPSGYFREQDSFKYMFDQEQVPCSEQPNGGDLVYEGRLNDTELTLDLGWVESEVFARMNITQENGVIVDIYYFHS